jgi:hypothetical protein
VSASTHVASTCPSTSDPASYEILGRLRLAGVMAAREEAPVLAPDALTGLAGEIIGKLAPITEATPAAMLATLLTTYGAMCGRNAHVLVGSKPHYPNIFAVVIGGTSKDRKGTSAAAVRPILDAADTGKSPFLLYRRLVGLQSGEALIKAAAEAGRTVPPDTSDPFNELAGIAPDQRLLVYEEEYAGRMLTAAARRDSILSAILRCAWDGEELANRTKSDPIKASHAHVAVLAHTTMDELLLKMSDVDVANGYANRFLHVLSRRTTLHSNPGQLPDAVVRDLGARLARAIAYAQSSAEITRSPEFDQAWDTLYRVVESQPTGGRAFGNLTARATAHLLRLSLLYALLDQSAVIQVQHLRSAIAFWDYCEATVAYIWGATLGQPKLDQLYKAIAAAGPKGLDRTEINGLFSNNLSKPEVNGLVRQLVDMGLARTESQPTGGRPREVLIVNED